MHCYPAGFAATQQRCLPFIDLYVFSGNEVELIRWYTLLKRDCFTKLVGIILVKLFYLKLFSVSK